MPVPILPDCYNIRDKNHDEWYDVSYPLPISPESMSIVGCKKLHSKENVQ